MVCWERLLPRPTSRHTVGCHVGAVWSNRFNAWALVVWPLRAPACVGDNAWWRGCSIACRSKEAKRVYMQLDTDMGQ